MVKITAKGGDKVGKGNYWSFDTGERVTLDRPGTLPGGRNATYYKGHPVLLILAAPVLGLVYAAFLPAVGFVMAVGTLMRKAVGALGESFSKATVFTWSPSQAYLAGKKRKKTAAKKVDEAAKERETPKE